MRADRIITKVRTLVNNQTENSYTDLDDDIILDFLNEGQRHLQELLINNNVNAFVKEYTVTLTADTEEYTLPNDVLDSSSIIKVEYTEDSSASRPRYRPLTQGTEIDRVSDISSTPSKYILRDKYDTD